MQPGFDQRLARLHAARHVVADPSFGLQRDDCGLGRLAIALLERCLQGLEGVGVHGDLPIRRGYWLAGIDTPARLLQPTRRPRRACKRGPPVDGATTPSPLPE